ncbi:MAG TPA: TIGR00730 family Rossman fold protein [Acidimicrobiia bacterium]
MSGTVKLPRYRTGDTELDAKVAELAERVAEPENADLIFELLASAVRLGHDRADRGDLKIANAAIQEMRQAFHAFAPYRAARKVAIFGSARTEPDDPLYVQAKDLAAAVAARDWMVVTGAGPGIMEAGIEGAGPDQAFGVGIKLPFETTTSQFFDGDPKLMSFRYFFTRKLEFIKESDAFVLLPGGFGTLDEAFELLTLLQTGKAQPAPVVLLDVPGGTYWHTWSAFVEHELQRPGYISSEDIALLRITDDVGVAVDEILGFYVNYHSLRFVEGILVLRMHRAPSPEELVMWNHEFADIVGQGELRAIDATSAEIADDDHVDLARVAFRFNRRGWSRLRMLIDRVNMESALME